MRPKIVSLRIKPYIPFYFFPLLAAHHETAIFLCVTSILASVASFVLLDLGHVNGGVTEV